MTLELALLALSALADPANRARPWEMQAIAVEAERARQRHSLPVGLLLAVVLAESGGRNIISRRRKCGGRDHGRMQIHAHDLSGRRLARLLTLAVNIDRGAYLLARSRERCSRPGRRCVCLEAEYNWNGRTRWCSRVGRIWRRLLERVQGGGLTS